MIGLFLGVGLVMATSWAVDTLLSTFKSGAGSWAGFRENWKLFKRPLVIHGTVQTRYITMTTWQRFLASIRAIPQSHFRVPQNSPVERLQSDEAANPTEANP
jgi:hypothetical protein